MGPKKKAAARAGGTTNNACAVITAVKKGGKVEQHAPAIGRRHDGALATTEAVTNRQTAHDIRAKQKFNEFRDLYHEKKKFIAGLEKDGLKPEQIAADEMVKMYSQQMADLQHELRKIRDTRAHDLRTRGRSESQEPERPAPPVPRELPPAGAAAAAAVADDRDGDSLAPENPAVMVRLAPAANADNASKAPTIEHKDDASIVTVSSLTSAPLAAAAAASTTVDAVGVTRVSGAAPVDCLSITDDKQLRNFLDKAEQGKVTMTVDAAQYDLRFVPNKILGGANLKKGLVCVTVNAPKVSNLSHIKVVLCCDYLWQQPTKKSWKIKILDASKHEFQRASEGLEVLSLNHLAESNQMSPQYISKEYLINVIGLINAPLIDSYDSTKPILRKHAVAYLRHYFIAGAKTVDHTW